MKTNQDIDVKINKLNFKPVPFYFLNDTFNKEEIDRQMYLMKESGVSGFFMHARCGLAEYGYGDKQWFDNIKYIVNKSAELGLDAWLYDEDPYPSGNAGGRISFEHPEYVSQKINVLKIDKDNNNSCFVKLGKCKPLKAYEVSTQGEVIKDLSDCFGTIRSDGYSMETDVAYYNNQNKSLHTRSATFDPQIMFHANGIGENNIVYVSFTTRCYTINRFGSLIDNLNKDAVNLFKKYSYENYVNSLSDKININVPGIFTDEPITGGLYPWTDLIEETFYNKKGYKIEDNYFYLYYYSNDKSMQIRKDYWEIASELFSQNYVKNLKEYSNKNGLLFVGHFECEENPYYQAIKCNNVYENLWHLDIPGFDILCGHIGDRNDSGLVFGAKLVSSVIHQKNTKRALCEMFAVNPYNFNEEGMFKIADWSFVMGLNLFVPHAFYYGYSGFRKKDAGKSFFFQDPMFNNFSVFANYADKMGAFLTNGQEMANTLLLYPNWEFSAVAWQDKTKSDELQRRLFNSVKQLLENHIEFDIVDCKHLLQAQIEDKFITIGKKKYSNIIYVSIDTIVMEEIKTQLKAFNCKIHYTNKDGYFNESELKKYAYYTNIKSIKGDEADLMIYNKKANDDEKIFIFNSSNKNIVFSYSTDKKVYCYDAFNDKYINVIKKSNSIILSLEGYKSIALLVTNNDKNVKDNYKIKEYPDKIYDYETNPQWEYIPPVNVNTTITKYNVMVNFEGKKKYYKDTKYAYLREIYGVNVKANLMSIARPVYDASIINMYNYPVNAIFETVFKDFKSTVMLFETETFSGDCEIYLNNKKLNNNNFINKTIYDFKNIVCDVSKIIKKGKNVLKIVFKNANEKSGINSAIYFI